MHFNRRHFLNSLAAISFTGLATPASAFSSKVGLSANLNHGQDKKLFSLAQLRGTANANDLGLRPDTIDDQSRAFQSILDNAARENKAVFLPPGKYFVSNIILPARTLLMGVPGLTQLEYSGAGHFLIAENAERIELSGIVINANNRGLHSHAKAALRLSNCNHIVIDNCLIVGSVENGIQVDKSAGRIERSKISGAGGACGIYAFENRDFSIISNEVTRCDNGGILVHRWENGDDGTLVRGNRVSHIGAANGGTGQWGNGINVFRAANVQISDNHVTDCLFSAIRSNAGNNAQIVNNTCLRSGETAIYSEFEFQGAVVSSNIIDGGARGISLANFMQGGRLAVIQGNLIRNITTPPPYEDNDHLWFEGISAEADTIVTGNVIENAQNYGLMLGWGPYLRDVVATSNVIRNSKIGIYVSVVEGIGKTHIADNTITGAKSGAVIGHHWKKAVTGDLTKDPSPLPQLTVERNRV